MGLAKGGMLKAEGITKTKGHEAGACLVNSRHSKEASVVGAE